MEVRFKEMHVSNLEQLRSATPVRMLLATVLALALSSTADPAHAEAAPAEPAATADVSSTAEQPNTDKGSGDEQKKAGSKAGSEAGSKDDEFIPTEEISEDFAVSFPVDI